MIVATSIIMMGKETLTSGEGLRACFNCGHFQMKQWDIGYCQLHQVNVLKTYGCGKFVPRDSVVKEDNLSAKEEGGDVYGLPETGSQREK